MQVSGTGSLIIPSGNTAQRPGTGVTGMIRINTQLNQIEGYDGSNWVAGSGTAITNQTLNGDGLTVTFVLDSSTTTAAALVMLNGVTQVPTQAYNMSPNPSANLVFTEAPAAGDVIDIRFL